MVGVVGLAAAKRGGHLDRLDAEFFDSEVVALEAMLQGQGAVRLATLADLSVARTDPSAWPDDTFPYLEIADVDPSDGFLILEHIPPLEAPSRARMVLHKDWIAISSVRPARSGVALISPDLERAVGSTGFVVLMPKGGVSPEALFVYLKTRFAVTQLTRRSRASMYPTLFPPDVLEIAVAKIPPDAQRMAQDAVREASAARTECLAERDAAERIATEFFARFGPAELLADLRVSGPRVLKNSEVFGLGSPRRLDAEFFTPAFRRLSGRLHVGPVQTLGRIASSITTGETPATVEYVSDDGSNAVVVKVGALTNLGIRWGAVDFAPPEFLGNSDSTALDGDLVLTSSAHAPSHISRKADVIRTIPAELDGRLTIAGELMKVRLRDDCGLPPEYVAAFLRSPLGGAQVRRCIRGITSHVYPDDVARWVEIPVPPEDVLDGIETHFRRAQDARWRHHRLVRDAISRMEAAIVATCA